MTYVTTENIVDTLAWLLNQQDCFDAFHFDVEKQELTVQHAAGTDIIRAGMYLTAEYGLLVTS